MNSQPELFAVLLLIVSVTLWREAECFQELLPFGIDAGDELAPQVLDDSSTPLVKIDIPCPFYGIDENIVHVNTHGHISFRAEFVDYSPDPFPIDEVVIAPFWNDIDVTGGGRLFFRQSTDPSLLSRLGNVINAAFETVAVFTPLLAFVATWDSVPNTGGEPDIVNTFQVFLATDGDRTYVGFLYEDIQWEGEETTIIGFNAGNDEQSSFTLPDSGDLLNLPNLSNVGAPGTFLFRVDEPIITLPTGSIECPPLPNPENGQVVMDGVTPGSVARYSCGLTFHLVGEETRLCDCVEWTGEAPTCEQLCSVLRLP